MSSDLSAEELLAAMRAITGQAPVARVTITESERQRLLSQLFPIDTSITRVVPLVCVQLRSGELLRPPMGVPYEVVLNAYAKPLHGKLTYRNFDETTALRTES